MEDAIESFSEGFVLYDADERLVICNSRYRNQYPDTADFMKPGVLLQDVVRNIGEKGLNLKAQGNADEWCRLRLEAFRAGIGTHELQLNDGRWIRATERRTRAGGIVAIRTDVTDRKIMEEKLQRSNNELEARVTELENLKRHSEQQAADALHLSEQLGEAKGQLSDAVENISEGFALWDAEDRLIRCNEIYRRIYTGLEDVLAPGLLFETFIRKAYARDVFARPDGDPEDAIWNRVLRHRRPSSVVEHELNDGRWLRVSKRKTGTGQVVGIVSDISERKQSEATIRRMALEDVLTGLPNRAQFQRNLNDAMAQCERTEHVMGLMLLDLDRFKNINDALGHPAGDELLRQVSARLLDCARKTDTVARLGGDEFAIIATNCKSADGATRLADRIVKAIAKPFSIDGNEIHTSTSIGVTVYPQDSGDAAQLLQNADLALYRAKDRGRGGWQIFDEAMNTEVKRQRRLETGLRDALHAKDFRIVYQPRYHIATERIVGAEALLRWQHPERGPVPPSEFIPAAESAGLIVPITEWLLRTVCRQNKAWQNEGLPPICVSVNLSPTHFKHRKLVEQVKETLRESALDPEWLELEITEGIAMASGDEALASVLRLKKVGVKVSIDDFGTGYSSLDRLKIFPVDALKIDRSFVRDIMSGENDAAICTAAIHLGQSLNIRVIAEGVETESQRDFLFHNGCEEAQGFLFSKPVPPEEFAEILQGNAARTGPFPAGASPSLGVPENCMPACGL